MMKYLLSEKCTRLIFLSALLYFFSFTRLLAADLPPCLQLADADSIRFYKGSSSWVNRNNGSATSLSYKGKIIFTENDQDIKSISPGGFFKYSKTTFGNCREIQVLSDTDGNLRRRYFVGRTEEPYEPEGRKWLQEMLPGIIASTGIGAEERVQRIFAKSGVKGVINEISGLDSDQVQSIYFTYLVTQPRLKDNDMRHILARVNHYIGSDYEKGKLLRKTGVHFLQHEKVVPEYLAAINNMSSDYEKAKAVTFVLQQPKLSPAVFTQTLHTLSGFSSDYEQAKVLRQVITHPALPEQDYKVIFSHLNNINSDHEKNRVLFAIMTNQKILDQHFDELLAAVRNITSDYDKSQALAYLVTKHKLTPQNYLQVLPVVADINSNYEKSKTLQRLKTTMPTDNEAVRAAYLKTAKTIASEHEYQRVMHGVELK